MQPARGFFEMLQPLIRLLIEEYSMQPTSSNRTEKFAWTLALLSSGYLFMRIGLGLLAS
jgi:hypothetical protein